VGSMSPVPQLAYRAGWQAITSRDENDPHTVIPFMDPKVYREAGFETDEQYYRNAERIALAGPDANIKAAVRYAVVFAIVLAVTAVFTALSLGIVHGSDMAGLHPHHLAVPLFPASTGVISLFSLQRAIRNFIVSVKNENGKDIEAARYYRGMAILAKQGFQSLPEARAKEIQDAIRSYLAAEILAKWHFLSLGAARRAYRHQ